MSKMHACMLQLEPRMQSRRPLSSGWRRCFGGCNCFLPSAWHYASRTFFSQKGLQMERERQIATAHCLLIHPYSPFKFYWDLYIMLVYTISLVYMPIQVFINCSSPYNQFVIFCDAMGFLYIFFNFFTGTVGEDGKNVNLDRGLIAKSYIKDTFVLDVLSALPLQVSIELKECRYPIHTVMYIFKLFRIIACVRVWRSLAKHFGLPYMWDTSIKTILIGIFFFHWTTACHYLVPVILLDINAYEPKGKFLMWLERAKVVSKGGEEIWSLDKYVSNLYIVASLCLGGNDFNVMGISHTVEEEILCAMLSLIGLFFVAYFLTAFIRLILYRNYKTYIFNGQLKEIQEYLTIKGVFIFYLFALIWYISGKVERVNSKLSSYKRTARGLYVFAKYLYVVTARTLKRNLELVPERLHQKVQLYINYCFNGHYFNQSFIHNTINVQIKQEINMHCCKKLVINVPLFRDMPIALINTIIFSLTQVLYMPGEIVVRYGHPGSSIYLIATGTVAIMDAEGKEVGHLKDGAFFGENSLLKPGTPRSATIIALEITEIYKLNHSQFVAALQPCPRLKRRLLGATNTRTHASKHTDTHTDADQPE